VVVPDRSEQYRELNRVWHQVLEPFRADLTQQLSELEFSHLANVIGECFDYFHRIYYENLPSLAQVRPDDFDALHDRVYDIGGLAGALTMIEEQIVAARPGFEVLLRLLADRATPPPRH
jgi:hypothetical protein